MLAEKARRPVPLTSAENGRGSPAVDDKYSFAAYLKQLITNCNIKPAQLAARLHVDDSLVRKWLAGSRVPPLKAAYLEQISACLDLGPVERLRLKKAQICSVDETIVTLPERLQNAENRASQQEESIMSLPQAIPETAFVLDVGGRIVAGDAITAHRRELPGAEPAGPDAFHHLPPDIARLRREKVARVFATGRPLTFRDYRDSRCILSSIYPLRNSAGAVTMVAVCRTDITALEAAYARLGDSEERLRLMYENNINPILLTSADGSILAANPAACAFFALTAEEICAVGRSGLIAPDDPNLLPALAERAAAGKAIAPLTFIVNGGKKKTALASSAQFRDSAGCLRAYVMIHVAPPY